MFDVFACFFFFVSWFLIFFACFFAVVSWILFFCFVFAFFFLGFC